MRTPELSDAVYYQIFDFKRGRGEKRKIQIVEALIECLATRGLDNTSFETLGKMVGMNRTHVAYYFQSRDDLVRTAVRYVFVVGQQDTITRIEKAAAGRARFQASIEGWFEWLHRHPKYASVVGLFYYLASYDKSYRSIQNSIRSMGEERILSTLTPFIEKGRITPAKARTVARSAQVLITGALFNFYASDYPLNLRQLQKQTVKDALFLLEANSQV
ncbi:MAG: TetR family transcriptional regulator [Bdellovibrionales bacterium]|nr:TetR family transcriptional regulator [Bdellovibrionales bacterium]